MAGVAAVALTGWQRLDPVVALIVAGNIVWTGVRIVRDSVSGLMDTALPTEELKIVCGILDKLRQEGIEYHDLRTRQAGARRFISLHVFVPGDWTVHQGHVLLDRIEAYIRSALPGTEVITHLEALDDPASWDDQSKRDRKT